VTRTAWRWFGPPTTLRFVVGLFHLVKSPKALSVVYGALGTVRFRREFCGRIIRWDHADIGFVWEIFDRRSYTHIAGMGIGDQDIVIDAGANIGVFTLFAAVSASQGRVIAIEPNPTNFRRLRGNVEANQLKNVTLVEGALASYDGLGTLWRAGSGSGSDSLIQGDSTKGESVPLISPSTLLARFALEHVDFLKLDIEGAEYDVFLSDLHWLKAIRRVALEAHTGFGHPRIIVERLRGAGFDVQMKPGNRLWGGDSYIYAARDTQAEPTYGLITR
jgi:FkbM family methyltransferase